MLTWADASPRSAPVPAGRPTHKTRCENLSGHVTPLLETNAHVLLEATEPCGPIPSSLIFCSALVPTPRACPRGLCLRRVLCLGHAACREPRGSPAPSAPWLTPQVLRQPALATLTGTMSALLPPARCTPGPCQSPHIISPARQGTCSLLSCLALPLEKKAQSDEEFRLLDHRCNPVPRIGSSTSSAVNEYLSNELKNTDYRGEVS